MSVNVKIKAKGIFKKKLKLEDVLKNNLSYGIMDENYRLIPNKTSNYTIIYDSKKIGRGFEFSTSKDTYLFSLPLPATLYDINLFYEKVKEICAFFKTDKFIRDDIEVNINEIERFIKDDIFASTRALDDICYDKDYETFTIFGALFPLSIGLKEKEIIKGNIDNFEKFLEEKQKMDVYYAAPKLYKKEEEIIGIFVISENIPSVVPKKPKFLMIRKVNISAWYVILGENYDDLVSYENFISAIKKKEYFDDEHFIICLTKKEIDSISDKYKSEL